MQYTVKKPINNNILRVVDPTGCELIVTGRGLGFGAKPGYKLDAGKVERSYRMTSPAVQQKLVELLEQIPYEHLLLTDELVEMIRSRVNYPLNESMLITLADHISLPSSAVSRASASPTRSWHRSGSSIRRSTVLAWTVWRSSASAAGQISRMTRAASSPCTSSMRSSTPP
ncbi:hypothetical protein DWV57_00695 [Faecalibacterium sp. AF10-46]|nr:hypothetical protein DWV57_00695 [Faecalibacterium sp. AF10-46]